MLDKASVYLARTPELITITKRNIIFYTKGKNTLSHSMNFIAFDRYDDNKISVRPQPNFIHRMYQLLRGIHLLHCENNLLRIIAFLLGIGCTILTATGLLFFSNKPKERLLTQSKKELSSLHKIIEGITLGVVMGSINAFIAYFWMNRILPNRLGNRIDLEIDSFFTVLVAILFVSICSALTNSTYWAWKKLIFLFSNLCLILPLFDVALHTDITKIAFINNYYSYFVINSFIFLLGCSFYRLYCILPKE